MTSIPRNSAGALEIAPTTAIRSSTTVDLRLQASYSPALIPGQYYHATLHILYSEALDGSVTASPYAPTALTDQSGYTMPLLGFGVYQNYNAKPSVLEALKAGYR